MLAESQTGFFISFEGSEGCGKSTQIRLLLENLNAAGQDPLLVREPGGTALGEKIRHLLQHAPEGQAMFPEAELLLFAASRAQLVREIILPALTARRIVISDRFHDSTTVYQGIARRLPLAPVEEINDFAVGSCRPNLTFLLDMDSTAGLKRARTRPDSGSDRMEQEPLDFYETVRRGYLDLAAAEPARFRILDATKSELALAREIRDELKSHVFFQGISL